MSLHDPSVDSLRSSGRWDGVLATVLGAILLGFGWADTRSFLASRHKQPLTFSFNALPGGLRAGPDGQEIFRDPHGDCARLENFGILENWKDRTYRHNFGPVSRLEIVTAHSLAGRLSFRYGNIVDDQDFAVACNGETLEQMTHLPPQEIIRRYDLKLHPGSNVVTFTCRRYLHDGTRDDPGDPRAIAGTFDSLDLSLE